MLACLGEIITVDTAPKTHRSSESPAPIGSVTSGRHVGWRVPGGVRRSIGIADLPEIHGSGCPYKRSDRSAKRCERNRRDGDAGPADEERRQPDGNQADESGADWSAYVDEPRDRIS